jgi:DNA repair protein RadC
MTIRTFRIELVRESGVSDVPGEILSDSLGVARVLAPEFEGLDREKFIVLLLDAKHRVTGVNTVSIGSLTASIVHHARSSRPPLWATLRRSSWLTTIRAEIRRRA